MRAGRLKEIVTLQKRREADEVTGGTWEDVIVDLRAEITPQIGNALEGFPSDSLREATIYKVSTRWFDDPVVTIDERLLWGKKILNIENVFNVDSANREMLLICQEGLNRG